MAEFEYDVAVIGAGPGGYVAAIRAAQLGLKVVCVDKGPTLGGTCLNIGCIPSKALLQSTEHYDWIGKSGKEHGITLSKLSMDYEAMMQRKAGIVKMLVDSIAVHFKKHNITSVFGEARFVDPHTIEVDGKKISSKNFIIATGSQPIALPFLPFDEKKVVSSTGALSFPSAPKRLLVIGGGAIGLELASVYRRLGSAVTIVEMLPTIAPNMDAAISKTLLQVLKKQGMEFYLGAKVTGAKTGKEIVLSVEYEQKPLELTADAVLVAVGRRAYTQNLGLDTIGIQPNAKGMIAVDANFRTNQEHIYAIGDVIDGPMLAHKASHEGMAVAELIAGKTPRLNYLSIPNVIYTYPEAASVGLTEEEAKQSGLNVVVGINHFRGNARARCNGEIDGFVKVIGEANTGRLIGMHILGAQASELIGEGMIAMDKEATLHDLADACHAHPTLSEAIMEACQQALGYPIHG